jgi:CheY-like chemotaxis protein
MYELTVPGYLDVFKTITSSSNVISSSSFHYDELITKLQLQAIMECEQSIQKWHLKIQEEALGNQKRSRRILIVDDEPDICMTFQIVLEDAGYECKSYTDSVKALQEFRPNYYDLILLDIQMRMLNGFELCKKIRELDNTPHVIFITASEEYYEKSRSQDYRELVNNNDSNISYIQTPIGNKELVQIVNMTIATKYIKKK